ncbi:O-acetylhomoserine/O-acetylserine sulfhydrylase-like pyridoxal-dependent enzyme [Mycolicibacterium sp. BK556]|nr:O-acetylhomoserine/O-acetylserine sulfhydrylase-like pyridoxal-dependent enzyme [Mycolicibacterium sp. BK556]MBB3631443.1 O-acetylhomoserine/O-acetylserine sulfhydrylase-like pyridoxal-dependent enzyme [Mycolicibacterium sp. BK607]MBB3749447.1 O-acetylhomoserine/O-acetylserine sulfhydrylase-like pyridoxal-dependent enzyme [Mycolicibacterium sp. BK634]
MYTAVGTAAAAMATRVQATGDKLISAATQYVNTEDNSAQRLAALGYGPGPG